MVLQVEGFEEFSVKIVINICKKDYLRSGISASLLSPQKGYTFKDFNKLLYSNKAERAQFNTKSFNPSQTIKMLFVDFFSQKKAKVFKIKGF